MAAVVPKPFVSTFNTFLASVGARDAVGKVLANSCKLAALRLKAAHGGDVDHKELVGRLDLVAKSAGTMRRFIRMGGFLKAVEAFPKVKEQDPQLKLLFQLELLSRILKDFLENVDTTFKFGFVSKKLIDTARLTRLLSMAKLLQATLSFSVTFVQIRRANAAFKASIEVSSSNEKTRHQLAKVRKELFVLNLTAVKLIADFMIAGSELGFGGFPAAQGASALGIFSGVVDVYKASAKVWNF